MKISIMNYFLEMNNPRISILMPVHNMQRYIRLAIDSILKQTFTDFELIIVDDGSIDDTVKIISEYQDDRIKCFIRQHKGVGPQLNFALSNARYDLVARMDADDISMLDKLQKQFNFLISNKHIDILGTNAYFIDVQGEKMYYKKFPQNHEDIEFMMPIINSILHPTILTYKKILHNAGGYRDHLSEDHSEDHELYLRLLKMGYKFHNIQEPLFQYRIIEKNEEFYSIQNKYFYESSIEYLQYYYSNKKSRHEKGKYYLRMGMLEYYKGSIKKSRKLFLKSFLLIPSKLHILVRYLLFTLFGNNLLNFLRKKKITMKINQFILSNFNIDTYNIKGF